MSAEMKKLMEAVAPLFQEPITEAVDVADQLEDLYDELKEIVRNLQGISRGLDATNRERMKRYVLSHLSMALDDEHEWLGGNAITLRDVIDDIRNKGMLDQ